MNDKDLDKRIKSALENNNDLEFYSTFEDVPSADTFIRKKRGRRTNIKKISFVATAAVILIVTVSGVTLYNNNKTIEDTIDPSKYAAYDQEDVIFELNDLNDSNAMAKAEKIFPGLEVEQTMFGEYEFENLVITKNQKNMKAISTYKNEDGKNIVIEQTGTSSLIEKE